MASLSYCKLLQSCICLHTAAPLLRDLLNTKLCYYIWSWRGWFSAIRDHLKTTPCSKTSILNSSLYCKTTKVQGCVTVYCTTNACIIQLRPTDCFYWDVKDHVAGDPVAGVASVVGHRLLWLGIWRIFISNLTSVPSEVTWLVWPSSV